jgi:hypothetical protein
MKKPKGMLGEIIWEADMDPLFAMFIINAAEQVASDVLRNKDEVKSCLGGIINPDAWIRTAEKVKAACDRTCTPQKEKKK